MYTNLQKILNERRISSYMLAPVIGTTQKTALNKIRGDTDFTLREAKKVADAFPEYDWRYLFDDDEEEEAALTPQ